MSDAISALQTHSGDFQGILDDGTNWDPADWDGWTPPSWSEISAAVGPLSSLLSSTTATLNTLLQNPPSPPTRADYEAQRDALQAALDANLALQDALTQQRDELLQQRNDLLAQADQLLQDANALYEEARRLMEQGVAACP